MKGMFLYGSNCQPWIWNNIKDIFKIHEIEYVEYPRDVTKKCRTVADLSRWVYETYLSNHQTYDFILGHSMGGIIALHLSALDEVHIKKTILVEAFLKPTEPFYRNLLMEENQKKIGNSVYAMLKEEEINYTYELKVALKEDFDYTDDLKHIHHDVYGLYGNRGKKDYPLMIHDLNLLDEELAKMKIHFIDDSCHLPMLENPQEFAQRVTAILG